MTTEKTVESRIAAELRWTKIPYFWAITKDRAPVGKAAIRTAPRA